MQKAREEYDTTMANVTLKFNQAPPNLTYAAATSVPIANARTASDACVAKHDDGLSCNMP